MKITMWMRPDQLNNYNNGLKSYASTFRDSDNCFQIEVQLVKIDLNRDEYGKGIPTNSYLIK